tara:strand:- start:8058 stop:8324 length:267 start_codon:yes stop_codon:yes gene_type:complete
MLDIVKVEDIIFESLIEHINLKEIELDNYDFDIDSKTYYVEYNICVQEYISCESTQVFENEIADAMNYLLYNKDDYNIDLKMRWMVKH